MHRVYFDICTGPNSGLFNLCVSPVRVGAWGPDTREPESHRLSSLTSNLCLLDCCHLTCDPGYDSSPETNQCQQRLGHSVGEHDNGSGFQYNSNFKISAMFSPL